MGLLDWLFGEEEEEEGESAPEVLVLGAQLKCVYGSEKGYLFVDSQDIDLNGLPEACTADNKALYNILPFGQCVMGAPCANMMETEEEWENPKPQTKTVNGKEVITTESTLTCAKTGMPIEAVSSGQDGVFASQILLMREVDGKYPGLRELLEDPYGSLYLNEGMYEQGIRFLEDRMEKNGGSMELLALDTKNSLEGRYITETFARLLPYVDTREPGRFLDGLQTVLCKAGMENGADPHILNADMIEILKADCGDYAGKVAEGGYYKWQEENKLFLNWAGEAATTMSYAVLAYNSMVNWKGSKYANVTNKEVSNVNIDAEKLKYSNSAIHSNRPYQQSTQTIQEIINSGTPKVDPRGSNGYWWDVEGSFNGTSGHYELLISPDKTTIWHYLFKGY